MKSIFILILVFPLLLAAQDRQKVVKFSHQFHITEAELECLDCHSSAGESTKADDNLLPVMDTCFNCHDDSDDNCMQCHDEDADFISWENPPRQIIYNHQKHLEMEGVRCQTCHQGLENVDYSSKDNLPVMATCIQCHNDSKAPAMCAQCHTQELAALKPVLGRVNFGKL